MIEIPGTRVLRFTYEEIDRDIKPLWEPKAVRFESWFLMYLASQIVEDDWKVNYIVDDFSRHFCFVILSNVNWVTESERKVVFTEKVVIM